MEQDIVARLYDARPFAPFIMHLADGRHFPIGHREFFARRPKGRTAMIFSADGALHVLDLLLVTDLEFPESQSRPFGP
jgi:hypothetical protein